MPIFQQGSLNTTGLIVPDTYVQIIPPSVSLLNGVATDILGLVGIASWGPVNQPVTVSSYADFVAQFGPLKNQKHDLGTAVAVAVLQGARNLRVVRVTAGSPTSATITLKDGANATGVTLTSKYVGSGGNEIQGVVSNGSKNGTYKVTVSKAGRVTEVFDNLVQPGSPTVSDNIWVNIANAINLGQDGLRGPSDMVVASVGAITTVPALASFTLAAGADGTAPTQAQLVPSVEGSPRAGIWALRNTGAQVVCVADNDDSTTWTTVNAYALSEGCYAVVAGGSGQTISAAITAKNSAGIDSYAVKVLLGDWCYFDDPVNGVRRLVSPSAYVAGRLANLSPEQSSLNKPIYGIVATQKTAAGGTYSAAELGQLGTAGIDVITNPSPGGYYFGCRFGNNASSNPVLDGDNYTRLINYITQTLNAGMGRFLGRLHLPSVRREAKATIDTFLSNMVQQGQLEAYSTVANDANNPPSRVALGYLQIDVKARFISIIQFLLINVEGGQSVTIDRVSVERA